MKDCELNPHLQYQEVEKCITVNGLRNERLNNSFSNITVMNRRTKKKVVKSGFPLGNESRKVWSGETMAFLYKSSYTI